MKKNKDSSGRGSPAAQKLGKAVRQFRLSRHMTQTTLAEAADLDPKYIGLVEAGRTNISLLNLLKLSAGLALSPAALLNAAFPPPPYASLSELEEWLLLLTEEDPPTLELLHSILQELKTWREASGKETS